MKVLLILVDGMRPDSLEGIPFVQQLKAQAAYTMEATTVYPSDTLPCHMSLFHSVDPTRHGTTTNVYAPQVRPIDGLFEVLAAQKKRTAMFYSWEQLRDVCRPGTLTYSHFCSCKRYSSWETNRMSTDAGIEYLTKNEADFTFLYLAAPDEIGHKEGWMSAAYMEAVQDSWNQIERILAQLPGDYTVIVTADHGGHDRIHGTDLPEDMTIPLFAMGPDFKAGQELENVSILDIAPTVAKLLGAEPADEWEGKCLY
jgi:predicted AlkP superfamily pyrophosphatase or phosphodiesterase